MQEQNEHPDTHNQMGDVTGSAVQAHTIEGGVHFHGAQLKPVLRERLVSDVSAAELKVRRAIKHEDATQELPAYVRRPHDLELDAVVTAAVAGRSGIAIVVSDSTSGKTRACYESFSHLREDATRQWRIWPPPLADARSVLEQLPNVLPGTVVWLDEVRRYLLDPPVAIAEGITAGLLALLHDSARSPVLIMGTLWPQLWDRLTSRDEFAALLDDHDIRVPDTFTEQDIAAALDTQDPRLAEAVRHARDGAVTQYLAGVPQLMSRYENAVATPGARGLVHAAIDARRLGHSEWIPYALLVAAALGYADAREQRKLDRDSQWPATVLPTLTRLGHGDTSLLHPSATQASYQLEEYLEQHGRRARADECAPAEFWDACLAHAATPGDYRRLATEAHERMLYSYALPMYERAYQGGDIDALNGWAALLAEQGDTSALHRLAAATNGEPVYRRLALLCTKTGDLRGAEEAWRRAIATGSHNLDHNLANALTELDPEQAIAYYRACGEDGMRRLPSVLAYLGRTDEAIEEYRALTAAGDPSAFRDLVELLIRTDQRQAAVRELENAPDTVGAEWLSSSAITDLIIGNPTPSLIARLSPLSDPQIRGALKLARLTTLTDDELRAETGSDANKTLIRRLVARGDEAALRQLAVPANPSAQYHLALFLDSKGGEDNWREALRLLEPLANGPSMSTYFAKDTRADILVKLSDHDELLRLARQGDGVAARRAASYLYKNQMLPELRELALPSGDKYVRRRLAALLGELGLDDELGELAQLSRAGAKHHAWHLLKHGRWSEIGPLVVSGDGFVQQAVTVFLRDTENPGDEATTVKLRGFAPDGTMNQ